MSHTKVLAALDAINAGKVALEKAMKANVGKFGRIPLTKENFVLVTNEDQLVMRDLVTDFQITGIQELNGGMVYKAKPVNLTIPRGTNGEMIIPVDAYRFDFIRKPRAFKIKLSQVEDEYVKLLEGYDLLPPRVKAKAIAAAMEAKAINAQLAAEEERRIKAGRAAVARKGTPTAVKRNAAKAKVAEAVAKTAKEQKTTAKPAKTKAVAAKSAKMEKVLSAKVKASTKKAAK